MRESRKVWVESKRWATALTGLAVANWCSCRTITTVSSLLNPLSVFFLKNLFLSFYRNVWGTSPLLWQPAEVRVEESPAVNVSEEPR